MTIDGELIDIPAKDQHHTKWIKDLSITGIDGFESMPNGHAVNFAKLLGIEKEVVTIERRTVRWKGACTILGRYGKARVFRRIDVPRLHGVSPQEIMVKHLEPHLQYKSNEKDLTLMKNIARGKKDGNEM